MAMSHIRVPSLLLALALGAAPWACAEEAPAKDAAKDTAKAEAGATPSIVRLDQLRPATAQDLPMDMAALLAGVPDGAVQDAVWKFVPSKILPKKADGRANKLLVVPVKVGKGGYKAGSPPVGPNEGRFIAWYLPVPDAKDKADMATLPPGAPRVASGFSVTPDGRIHWSVDRFANTMDLAGGGSVTDEKTFYLFSLDRARLKALAVPPYKKGPPFVSLPKSGKFEPADAHRARNEAAKAAHAKQEAVARAAHDEKRAQHAAAFEAVGALPDKLSAPAPAVVYAVYYVPAPPAAGGYNYAPRRPQEISFVGYPQGAWKPSPEAWDALVALAKGTGAAPSAEARKESESRIQKVAADLEASGNHPLAADAAAVALASSGLLNGLKADATAGLVAGKVLDSKVPSACGGVMRALLAADDSAAKADLLVRAVAASEATGGDRAMADRLRVSALRVMLRAAETDTDAKRVDALNKAFADPAGAAPETLFAEFLSLFEDKAVPARFGGPMGEERAKAMEPLFKFHNIADAKRRAKVLAAVAAAGQRSPLAAVLVDVAMLSNAGIPPLDGLAAVAAAGAGQVPLAHAKHGLLPKLADQDGAVRAAAWRALASCRIQPKPAWKGVDQEAVGIVVAIVDAGLAQKPVPPELAPFLIAHIDVPSGVREAAFVGLAREIAEGGEAGRGQALAFFRKPAFAPALAGALEALDAETRWKAVVGCYAAGGLKEPLPAGLLLSAKESASVAQWFAAEFAKGNLPMPSQYAGLIQDKAKLMDWVMVQEPRLARAAVAILVYQEGGDDAQAAAMAGTMLAEPYKLRAQMERKWETCRNALFAAMVKASAGDREVRLAVFRKGDQGWRESPGKEVALKWKDAAGVMATGVPGVDFQMDADKKVIVLSDVGLLDRLNPKMRHALDLGAMAGAAELSWKAPCWEARLRPEPDLEVVLRVAPVGWKTLPELPDFAVKK